MRQTEANNCEIVIKNGECRSREIAEDGAELPMTFEATHVIGLARGKDEEIFLQLNVHGNSRPTELNRQ